MTSSATMAYVLNGPNLNLLGDREPEVYGSDTLDDIRALCIQKADALNMKLEFRQTNHEGTLIDWVQEAAGEAAGVVLNAGGYSHSSIALLDAVRACRCAVIEVHLSNVNAREDYRHVARVGSVSLGTVSGLGPHGYVYALEEIHRRAIVTQEQK